jgi:hypothetical protein
MPTTTTTLGGFMHHRLSETDIEKARAAHHANWPKVFEIFAKTHGYSSDNNIISDIGPEIVSSFTPRLVVRTWSDLVIAQAWVDFVLAGNLEKDLEFPIMVMDCQVDPE